jgi:hypothetical protein
VKLVNSTAKKADWLVGQARLSDADGMRIYEGLFVGAVANFEALVEDVFIAYLLDDGPRRRVRPRAKCRNTTDARSIVLGERDYVRWLPYSFSRKRAVAFLSEGRPFSKLSHQDEEFLGQCLTVRNAIAHRSETAVRKFRALMQGRLGLGPQEATPGSHLRSVFRVGPRQRRLENYLAEMARIARFLCLP